MTPVAKLHHFVPQAYLRGFATEKERIVAVPLDTTRSPFTTVVKNVGAQTHFHTIPGVDEPDGFEKYLSSVEGEASAIIRRIEGGEFPLPQEDRMTLSHYLALQAVRGPDTRRTIEHLQAKMIRLEVGAGGRQNVGKWIQGYFGFDADEDQQQRIWDEATQPGGPPLTIAVGDHIRHMVETAEELTVYLVTRPWSLHQFDRRSLITCDAPVSLIRGRDDAEPWMGVGFANASAISVPLTRKLGLIMSDPLVLLERFEDGDPGIQQVRDRVVGGQLDAVQVGTTAVERLINEHTAHNAREYIYRHPDDQRFVPAELPGPNLITMDAHGLLDADFDGEPWFSRDRGQSDQD